MAARASVYLAILSILAVGNPVSGSFVNSPGSAAAKPFRLRSRDLCVIIKEDGTIFVGRNWYPDDEISSKLAWLCVHNPSSRFVLRVDRHAQIARVRTILSAARTAGFQLITVELQPSLPLLSRRLAAGTEIEVDTAHLVEPSQDSGFQFIVLD
jgi:biopolymer transport protein ExbD